MARVLITGASGFIGYYLSLAMAEAGWEVRGLGRSSQPFRLSGIEWISGDIRDPEVTSQAVIGSDVIVHLACLSLGECTQNPRLAAQINIEGTIALLEAAHRLGTKRFIFSSTSQVYGNQSTLPNHEFDIPQLDSVYAVSKLSAELWCEFYRKIHQLPAFILRIFNVYGPSPVAKPRPTVETLFLRQLKGGQPLSLRGNPKSGRDFIHVKDVVRAIVLATTCPPWTGPLNIGTGVLTTIEELALLVSHICGKNAELKYALTHEEAHCLQADTSRAQALLGFRSSISLETGLRELWAQL